MDENLFVELATLTNTVLEIQQLNLFPDSVSQIQLALGTVFSATKENSPFKTVVQMCSYDRDVTDSVIRKPLLISQNLDDLN